MGVSPIGEEKQHCCSFGMIFKNSAVCTYTSVFGTFSKIKMAYVRNTK